MGSGREHGLMNTKFHIGRNTVQHNTRSLLGNMSSGLNMLRISMSRLVSCQKLNLRGRCFADSERPLFIK